MRKMIQLIILSLMVLTIGKSHSATQILNHKNTLNINKFCLKKMELTPTKKRGREKPLYIHATKIIKYLTGQIYYQGHDPSVLYCKLSFKDKSTLLSTPIRNKKVRKLLKMHKNEAINFNELTQKVELLRKAYDSLNADMKSKDVLKKLLDKVNIYNLVTSAKDWQYPIIQNQRIIYRPLYEIINEKQNNLITHEHLLQVILLHNKVNQNRLNLELKYAQMHPESYALLISFLALIAILLFSRFEISLVFMFASMGIQALTIASRIYIVGLSKSLGIYELILLIGLLILLLALIIGHYKKSKKLIIIGLTLNIAFLILSMFNERMFDIQVI